MRKRPYSVKAERLIRKLYEQIYKKVFNNTVTNDLYNNSTEELEKSIQVLINSEKYEEFAIKFSKTLAKYGLNHQRGLWRKYYNAAKQSHYVSLPKTYSEYEKKIMQSAAKNNFEFIKSIPEEMMKVYEKKYVTSLIEGATGSKGRKYFENVLKKSGATNAKLIARTETAKMQTAIERESSLELGSVAYIWSSSNDKRTRPSHKNMNKVVVFWRNDLEKPNLDGMYGDAGEFPNCRCDNYPIFDERDLPNPFYKVYDYKTTKIITMKRKDLLEALTRGYL